MTRMTRIFLIIIPYPIGYNLYPCNPRHPRLKNEKKAFWLYPQGIGIRRGLRGWICLLVFAKTVLFQTQRRWDAEIPFLEFDRDLESKNALRAFIGWLVGQISAHSGCSLSNGKNLCASASLRFYQSFINGWPVLNTWQELNAETLQKNISNAETRRRRGLADKSAYGTHQKRS